MTTLFRKSWFSRFAKRQENKTFMQQTGDDLGQNEAGSDTESAAARGQTIEFDINPTDPLLAYLLSVSSVVEIDKLHLESPTLSRLREAGVKVVVPLISQGELIGLLNLGPRRSEQEYSADDRRLLNTLAAQAAPALRVAQLARQQQAEARERERIAQELRVARVIQQTLLPKEIPALPGWQMAAYWQPARAVSGDFYDFISFPDGRLGIIVGDVTDKGVPAALVMATTRSILRTAAERLVSPGAVLEQANNNLCPDIPPNMFVTCLYALLDPGTGKVIFANAGHNLPYQRTREGVVELRARGMPLGLMPEMPYEEKEAYLAPGDQIILYSDGLIEAHNPNGEMFSFPRLRNILTRPACANEVIPCMLSELADFTGSDWEQEDDVTFVSLARDPEPTQEIPGAGQIPELVDPSPQANPGEQRLGSFSIASQPGNERQAMDKVSEAVAQLGLPAPRLERLRTAVAEATMNAMEHGNHYQPDLPVDIEIILSENAPGETQPGMASTGPTRQLVVRIRDHGGSQIIAQSEAPDLDAKLAGLQSPRGWGLFLIKNMVDEMQVTSDETHHTVELILHLEREA